MVAAEELIDRLAADLAPVRRLPPPGLRAALWLLAVAALAAMLVLSFSDLATFARRAAEPKLMVELIATLLTGIFAVIAAFELSVPDGPGWWALLPVPTFLLWLGSSGYSCWRYWIAIGPGGWRTGESADCFVWIVGVSVPLAVGLLIVLRRSRPLAPLRVAVLGGLGVASIAAFLLQFFHPFDVTFMDLGVHVAGVTLVTLIAALAARPALT
jgi:hypothetical protein